MEFERAIFRVYERCLEGLRDEGETNVHRSKSCTFLEFLAIAVGTFMLASLVLLHTQFVGNPGCMPYVLANAQNITLGPDVNSSMYLKYDQILNIHIDPKLLPPSNLRGRSKSRRRLSSSLESSWREEQFVYLNTTPGDSSPTTTSGSEAEDEDEPFDSFDYQFSFNLGMLFLPSHIRRQHNFEIVNVTLLASEGCFGGATSRYLISTGGMDTMIINTLMATFKRPGYMVTSLGEYFKWTAFDLAPYSNVGQFIEWKVNVFLLSVIAFFFLSTITALLVRVLISSGVVLLFPVFWLIQYCGFPAINLRIISLSYPWIGVPLELIRNRNQSMFPFVLAHTTRVALYYVLYQTAQMSFGMWFYRPNGSPGQPEVWLFAVVMIVEYFSMIYIRAKRTIQIFPRAFFLMFLLWHFYYYSFPAGFHMLALGVLLAFSTALMCMCVGEYEVAAYYTGVVNIDTPRAQYNALPWTSLRADLAHDFTMFMPITETAVGLYDVNVPSLGASGGTSPAGGATAVAGAASGSQIAIPTTPPSTNSAGNAGGGASGESIGSYANGGIGSRNDPSVSGIELTRSPGGRGGSSRNRMDYSRLADSSMHNAADPDDD